MRIAFVSTYPPRRCGVATFTSDLMAAVRASDVRAQCRVAAIDERSVVRAYGTEVRWRIRQGSVDAYVAAAKAINDSTADVVCVQHEFGLYGLWKGESFVGDTWIEGTYDDHLSPFLEELRKPSLVTMHTVIPEPSPAIRAAVRHIAEFSHGIVVMAETAVDILADVYGVQQRPTVIHHGMPHIEPKGRRRLKAKLGLDGRTIVSTFGLVGPGKGLEYAIQAMPAVVKEYPDVLYLIAGQTHPELLRLQGEQYRNKLTKLVDDIGMTDHVAFVNQYLEQRDIIDYLLATDVYVTPYLDPNQITSGTLAYALGAGKAVVSTPYLHATEALAEERGVIVDFRSAAGISGAINRILGDPELKARLEHDAYEYANRSTWPKAGARFLAAMGQLIEDAPAANEERTSSRRRPVAIAHRLEANPLIVPADIEPSQPGFEVVSTINPGVAKVGEETVLMVRVAERPRRDAAPPEDAMMIDLTGPEPRLTPMPAGLDPDRFIGMAFLDTQQDPARVVLGFVPRDLPGLDLSDPRTIRYRPTAGGFTHGNEEFTDYLSHISHLRVARSWDGIHFDIDPAPTISPSDPLEEYGVEDARVTEIEGLFHITYVSVSRLGIATSRLTTTDFRSFERQGVMMHPDQKDVVLFPERINGRYVALTRPMPGSFGRVLGIWMAESGDMEQWGRHRPVALPRPGMWDEMRIGASCVPIRVPEGWLELYHGADRANRYGMGALLLDGDDPSRLLARTTRPLLVPEAPYEHDGFFRDVVFPSGHAALPDGKIRVYYGAADTSLAAADFSIADILANVQPC